MIKKFNKGKLYTLCLAKRESDDIFTWCVNVQYKGRICGVLEFTGCETVYTVDLDFKMVVYECTFCEQYFNPDTSQYEFDEVTVTEYATLCNIVAGWQY